MSKLTRTLSVAVLLITIIFLTLSLRGDNDWNSFSGKGKEQKSNRIPVWSEKSHESPHQTEETNPKAHVHEEAKLLSLVTFVDSLNMKLLREFVGSIHVLRHDNFDVHNVIVFSYRLSKRELNELKIWRNVDVYDVEDDLMMDPKLVKSLGAYGFEAVRPPHELVTLAMMFVLRKYRTALYVKLGLVFTADSLHDMERELNRLGFVFRLQDNSKVPDNHMSCPVIGLSLDNEKAASNFIRHPIQCMRGFQCDKQQIESITSHQNQLQSLNTIQGIGTVNIAVSEGQQKYFCSLLLRDEAIFKYHKSPITEVPNPGKPIIAFGSPTLSVQSLEKPIDVASIRLFLPSLLRSVSEQEWQSFNFRLYIGYDEGDKFYDDPKSLEEILAEMKKMIGSRPISIHPVKFPYSKGWVTFLWNGLFVQSISEGADYFYQLNDDAELFGEGWITAFVAKLKSWNNIGVVGPKDNLHGRMLLTQAFVHRSHYEIFGKLYPQEIKDWYSDDWISKVYGDSRSHQFPQYTMINHNDKGTRYQYCGEVNLDFFLTLGKNRIKAYEDRKFDLIS